MMKSAGVRSMASRTASCAEQAQPESPRTRKLTGAAGSSVRKIAASPSGVPSASGVYAYGVPGSSPSTVTAHPGPLPPSMTVDGSPPGGPTATAQDAGTSVVHTTMTECVVGCWRYGPRANRVACAREAARATSATASAARRWPTRGEQPRCQRRIIIAPRGPYRGACRARNPMRASCCGAVAARCERRPRLLGELQGEDGDGELLDDAELHGPPDEPDDVVHAHLAHHARPMRVHRLRTQVERPGDLTLGLTLRDEGEHLALAGGELFAVRTPFRRPRG